MIDKKKITEAAIMNADNFNPCRSTLDREEACRTSFEDGVAWFKQNLWHDKDEIPQTEQRILIMSLDNSGSSIINTSNDVDLGDFDKKQQWETFCEYVDTDFKWCYIEDLLPNK